LYFILKKNYETEFSYTLHAVWLTYCLDKYEQKNICHRAQKNVMALCLLVGIAG